MLVRNEDMIEIYNAYTTRSMQFTRDSRNASTLVSHPVITLPWPHCENRTSPDIDSYAVKRAWKWLFIIFQYLHI